jgi:hypothetical protein
MRDAWATSINFGAQAAAARLISNEKGIYGILSALRPPATNL